MRGAFFFLPSTSHPTPFKPWLKTSGSEYLSADYEITDEVGHITGRISRLKNIYPKLRVNIAIVKD
jgi:hypothetical protein